MSVENQEKKYFYWLSRIPGIGGITARHLWEHYGGFEALYNNIEGKELEAKKILNHTTAQTFQKEKNRFSERAEEYDSFAEKGIMFCAFWEVDYPKRLLPFRDRPAWLYKRGRFPDESRPTAAIIGARSCSIYGRQVAEYLGSSLAKNDIQVISGLAAGIDGAGHRGALREGKDTYGILGSGINICYPKEHYPLYEQMSLTGGIISECHLGEKPAACNFPMRNRIISGLSDVIIVVEAREKSGSLITVEFALEQGKEVFAVPGPITEGLSRGCNRLIRAGANVLTSPEDVLEYFQIRNQKILRVHEKNTNMLAKKEKMVYSCLDLRPKFIDEIVIESGLSIGECITTLLELELGEYIVQTASHYYARKL